MRRVGLVLGAGGVVGQAYHSGVLAALEHDYGWDPRTAEVIVGTSAGSITGSLLRSGVPASDLASWTVKAPLTAEGRLLHDMFGHEVPEFEPFRPVDLLRRLPNLPAREMIEHAIVRPWHFRPLAAALALLAPGKYDIVQQLSRLGEVEGGVWPEKDLWICAVRRRDGRRVVFGHPDAPRAPLNLAVAASCAVPGYFAPVCIGDQVYVDGGAHSPTNGDLLLERDLDLVIIVSPMSGPTRVPTDLYGASRWHAARLARYEAKRLRAQGTEVIVFRPGASVQAVMGNDFMGRHRVEEILQESFLSAGAYASRAPVRDLLAAVAG